MNFVANTDALIFDLRRNGGGSPVTIGILSSYLFNEVVHLNDFYVRETDSRRQFFTRADVQGRRYGPDKPVFILTSRRTFSAAEEFTYNLKNLKRATIVGETTGGGAHPGASEASRITSASGCRPAAQSIRSRRRTGKAPVSHPTSLSTPPVPCARRILQRSKGPGVRHGRPASRANGTGH